ncbi:type IV toxin-antitoxin system AbiEi family antitoxin domain-containing protein [Paenarthrobacter nitroguajacolicus]|uniref:type IV toxin-antitoxin system AbiEi family antitoxin domain-containing protein n=1 Tax=Paenarthrobacter nitroguajacolicus TaxID=211146 RepID=UPI002119834D|nr:type IV toxin-antitoxin system AbiEi family antitoxin domain-containing protein [Paenarthrobacter nitroguajacolicus]
MEPEEALRRLGGVAMTRQVRARGVSESAIRSAVLAGSIQRIERGVPGLPGADPELVVASQTHRSPLLAEQRATCGRVHQSSVVSVSTPAERALCHTA